MLGGTFDPVHLGHLASARAVAAAFSLENVLLVLSARPPHRQGRATASIDERMTMLALATAANPLLVASDIEVQREGPSYTYDTLEALRASEPCIDLYLVIGMDAFAEVSSWHRSTEILETSNVIVTSRPGYAEIDDLPNRVAALGDACYDPGIGCYVHSNGNVLVIHDVDTPDISASDIRRVAASGKGPNPIDGLVTPEVVRFIDSNGLYRSEGN